MLHNFGLGFMDLGQFMLCSKLVVTSRFHWLTWCLLCKALTVSKSRPTSPSDKMASFSWIQDFISSQESKNNSTLTPPPQKKKKEKEKEKEKKRNAKFNISEVERHRVYMYIQGLNFPNFPRSDKIWLLPTISTLFPASSWWEYSNLSIRSCYLDLSPNSRN